MKKIIILTMSLAFAATSFGQQTTPNDKWKESEYYKKSKRQKTAAWILLGSGVGLFAGGMIAHFNYIQSGEGTVPEDLGLSTGTYVALGGIIVAGGSIPLFIASSKNKQKAKATSVFIDMENAPLLRGTVFTRQSFPAVGVKIHF